MAPQKDRPGMADPVGQALWLLNRWLSTPNKSETKKSGDIPMYIMIAIGVYYIYRIFTTGSF